MARRWFGPEEFRPPASGSGSDATAVANVTIDPVSQHVWCELEVNGIARESLVDESPITVAIGGSESNGSDAIDLVQLAGENASVPDVSVPTATGFRLSTQGSWFGSERFPGRPLHFDRLLAHALDGELYVQVKSTGTEVYRSAGEIRGPLSSQYRTERFIGQLDESHVVRPFGMRPPNFGTGSEATGETTLELDYDRGRFRFILEVSGIAVSDLDESHGGNETAVHLRWGSREVSGPIIVDVQHFAREAARQAGDENSNGVVATEGGFRLEAEGPILRVQGAHDTRFGADRIVDLLRSEDIYVDVHTTDSDLFRLGEIRGNLRRETPSVRETIELRAELDGAQIVRPAGWTPPFFGSGSKASGEFRLVFDTETLEYESELEIRGIDSESLFAASRANLSSILVRRGTPAVNGTEILDIEFAAGDEGPIQEPDSWTLSASGFVSRLQGRLDTGLAAWRMIDALRCESAYVVVHTVRDSVSQISGEVRGALRLVEPKPDVEFQRGDCNGDGSVLGTVADAVFLLSFNFLGRREPPCLAACDANGDGRVLGQVGDAIFLLTFNFLGGPSPALPYPDCGEPFFPSDEELGCEIVPSSCL